jgi:putative endonuclease
MIRQFTSKTQQIGQIGEEKALVFLVKLGFTILGQNINNHHGEIDIVAKKKKIYYFFEVKSGNAGSWFNPANNLTKEKLWKFFRAVEYFCLKEGIKNYRMQGVIVLLHGQDREAAIEIIDLT